MWTGGGLGPMRLDRPAIAARLGEQVPGWILDGLLDPYEAAVLTALAKRPPSTARTAKTEEAPDGG